MWISLLFLSTLGIVHCSCPSGCDLVRDGECRGKYKTMDMYWDTMANSLITACNEIQANPVIVLNDEQQSYWTNVAQKSTTKHNYVAIGLLCNTNSKRWEWADGSSIDYKPSSYESALDSGCTSGLGWIIQPNGYWTHGSGHGELTWDIFCTTQLQQPVQSADGCDNFDDDEEDGVCYQIGTTAENWQDAQKICRNFGADLASIHNEKENAFVRRMAISRGKVDSVYLGGTPSGKGDGYGWIDGTEWNYDNFYPGFPNKALGDCIAMDTDSTSGLWANVECSSKLPVACIRQQNYTGTLTCSAGPWKEGDVIYSPGFPFDASIPCDFLLTVDTGKKVQVEILLLEANSCCDHLLIYENYIGGTIIANLTGEINDKKYSTSSSNYMRVSWQPNGGTNVRGMMMTFHAV